MAELIRKAVRGYQYMFEEIPDDVTKTWLFVAKPYQGLLVLGLYLMFVLKWGPKWMKNRPPFKLEKIMMVYNIFQVIACAYVFIRAIRYGWGGTYKLFCEPIDYSLSEIAMKARHICYDYYMLKIIDLMDTIFFVLRKKFDQITFLHVYHHTGMVMLIWAALTYYPGGHGTLVGVINSLVHVIMYFYYFLTVAVPSVKKSLWWKKYITQLQIVQFILCVLHMGSLIVIPDCKYPRWIAAVFVPQDLFMLILFTDFYIKTYVKKPKEAVSIERKETQQDMEKVTGQNGHRNGNYNGTNGNHFESQKQKSH